MGIKLGKNAKLYWGAATAAAGTATTEIGNAVDVELSMSKTMADTMRRESEGWESQKAVSKQLTITFKLINKTDAAAVTFVAAVKNAWMGDTQIALKALDAEGGSGPDGNFDISDFKRAEPIKDVQSYDVTATVNDELRNPVWP